jgi:hypothetical protein
MTSSAPKQVAPQMNTDVDCGCWQLLEFEHRRHGLKAHVTEETADR